MSISIAILISIFIGAIIGGITFFKKDKNYKNAWKYLTSILRGLSVAIIVFLLLAHNLQYTSTEKKKPVLIWLQDNSESLKQGLKNNEDDFLSKQKSILQSLDSEYEVNVYTFGEQIEKKESFDYSEKITHIDFALQNILNRYQKENLGAIILASDGIYNRGSDPNYSISNSNNSFIYTIALGDSSTPKDISIQRVYANKIITVGNEFEIAFDIKFSQFSSTTHTIHLKQNGNIIKSKSQPIEDDLSIISESFLITANQPGIQHFQIEVPVAENEVSESNNSFDFFIEFVSNETKVLVINNGAHPDLGFIGNALKTAKGFKYNIAAPQTLPDNFNQYDILILHQPSLSPQNWKKILDSKIPTWHILGTQVNPLHAEFIKNTFNIKIGNSILPIQNTNISPQFNLFRLPLSAQEVFKKMPPLESKIISLKGTNPSEAYLKTSQTDVWLFSSTQAMAITIGEGIWKWGIYEMKDFKSNIVTHELIQQTLHTLKKPQLDKTLSVFLNKKLLTDQEHIAISAEVRNKNGQLINSSDVNLTIQNNKEYKNEFTFERLGNSYHILIPPLEAGEYSYEAETILDGKKHFDKGQFIIENIPLEWLNTQADYSLLYNLAANNNGKMYTIETMTDIISDIKNNEKITTIIQTEAVNNPWIHYKWIFFLIIGLLTIEWFIRKYFAMQ